MVNSSSIDHTNHSPFASLRPAARIERDQQDFLGVLGIAERSIARPHEPGSPEEARHAAEEFVALTFVQPILKEARESIQTPPPFGPSDAEKQLAALSDAKLALDIVRAAQFPLVERLARDVRTEPDALHGRHGRTS